MICAWAFAAIIPSARKSQRGSGIRLVMMAPVFVDCENGSVATLTLANWPGAVPGRFFTNRGPELAPIFE